MAQLNFIVIGLIFLLAAAVIRLRWQRQPVSNNLDLQSRKIGSPDGDHDLVTRHISRERPERALQATAQLNQAYLRLVSKEDADWQDRVRSFGAATQVVRETMVDCARQARGGCELSNTHPLDGAYAFTAAESRELAELDDALRNLEQQDPQQGQIVQLRYFGGLSVEETARVLGISSRIVNRDWNVARAWLHGEISSASQ